MIPRSWKLELALDESARLLNLQRPVVFERVAQDVAERMAVLCCHRSSMNGTSFSRVAFCVQVDRDLFDLFFNSENGYRAAYHRSPWEGLGANTAFMQAVSAKLVESDGSHNSSLTPEFVRESLATPSAKVWLAERGKEASRDCVACRGEWSAGSVGDVRKPEILNGRWEQAPNVKANWGSKAPYLTKLRILGAFLDDRFNELIPFDKRFRAREIHELGWS